MPSTKMTFTLDDETAARIDRIAERLRMPKSGVVREAIRDYAALVGRLSERERRRMLEVFDDVIDQIPERSLESVEQEIETVRRARRGGGRRSATSRR
jgi:metal-responsive CopG/Arc/MetJ family transcriptional regulator